MYPAPISHTTPDGGVLPAVGSFGCVGRPGPAVDETRVSADWTVREGAGAEPRSSGDDSRPEGRAVFRSASGPDIRSPPEPLAPVPATSDASPLEDELLAGLGTVRLSSGSGPFGQLADGRTAPLSDPANSGGEDGLQPASAAATTARERRVVRRISGVCPPGRPDPRRLARSGALTAQPVSVTDQHCWRSRTQL
jgi:hypothetical protein